MAAAVENGGCRRLLEWGGNKKGKEMMTFFVFDFFEVCVFYFL